MSSPMVRAILEGRKSQTRRVMKPQPVRIRLKDADDPGAPYVDHWAVDFESEEKRYAWPIGGEPFWTHCPYGVPGGRLWVRETFAEEIELYGSEPPYRDGRPTLHHESRDEYDETPLWTQCHYRATDPDPDLACHHTSCEGGPCRHPWKPSIFLPRWASRITLEITEVHVQRVQDINHEDSLAEGCSGRDESGDPFIYRDCQDRRCTCYGPKAEFARLWDSINGKKHPWASNPWVWAVSFRRVIAKGR